MLNIKQVKPIKIINKNNKQIKILYLIKDVFYYKILYS